ncbi:hypothetical protein [Sphaerisporangium album]|uniref:hypothetical protein n=1 Tax=Sphaerisporangium album TaxID=509200 RepID=UPI0011C0619C|nr:hypothetical protein [Sphaerisporangium album]
MLDLARRELPRQGASVDRKDELLSLSSAAAAYRDLLTPSAANLHKMYLLDNPAPIVARTYKRITHPRPGDLVAVLDIGRCATRTGGCVISASCWNTARAPQAADGLTDAERADFAHRQALREVQGVGREANRRRAVSPETASPYDKVADAVLTAIGDVPVRALGSPELANELHRRGTRARAPGRPAGRAAGVVQGRH